MDELSREARALLAEARRAYDPDPGAADRVLAKVMAAAQAPVISSAALAKGASGASGFSLKATVFAGLVLAAAGAVFVGGGLRETPHEPAAVAASPAPPIAHVEAAPPPAPPAEAVTAPAVAAPEAEPAPRPEPAAQVAAPARRRASNEAAPPDLAEELRLLREAQSALSAGRGGEALALLRDHQRAFPRTQFRQERDAIRILALCDTGRDDAARRLAVRFLAHAGRSPMAGAVRESCAGR
jgi:hypothetical protein